MASNNRYIDLCRKINVMYDLEQIVPQEKETKKLKEIQSFTPSC
jgi:hypothetical protein